MTEPSTKRTPLSRAEFLQFNRRWTDEDRAVIQEHLDATGAATFEEVDPPGYNHYVEVSDADGNVLMHVSKGTIYRDGDKHRLSTTRGGRGGSRAETG
ncbi:hypothetical protein GCM10023340_04040 [Nocardioides marinquilinus]|uniref:Uncharacterized protein n=1 Tax=Nocardioides marinquilinus TaxID=1210400 RepID=A0ABP9P6T8_9ACTN